MSVLPSDPLTGLRTHPMKPPLRLLAAAAVFAAALALPAQVPVDTSAGSRLQVSLLTFGQGDPVFERFGHNAIRIHDPLGGLDSAWNWGMFSFDEPNFLGRFLSGDSRYWMEGFPTEPLLADYRQNNRATEEQVLNLSAMQKDELLRFVRLQRGRRQQVLPLRLLPRQLLHARARRPRQGAGWRAEARVGRLAE